MTRKWLVRIGAGWLAVLLLAASFAVPADRPASASGTLPTASELIQMLKTKHPNKGHPRIMATSDDFAAMRQRIASDSLAAGWYSSVKADADAILNKPLPSYSSSLLNTSREVLNDVRKLALVAQVEQGSNRTPYVNKAWAILQAAGNFPDWNPSHFLDTAEMTMAFAIGYDWLYQDWTATQRTFLRDAIVNKGLTPAKNAYDAGYTPNGAWWANVTHNWNTVVNSGISNGALAVADESTTIEALAGELLELALVHIQKVLPPFAPDGGGEEGTGYWRYNMEYFVNYVSTLQAALGDDFGMTSAPGIAETAYFPIFMAGPRGSFNYGNNYTEVIRNPFFFWFALQFNNGDFAKHRLAQLTASVNPAPPHELDLLWYRPVSPPYTLNLPLDHWFEGIDAGSMRSAWDDPNALFVAFKGGSNQFNHSHLDHGTFVLHALGVRWAEDLGPDDYNLPDYFDNRSLYYRQRTEGHNTIVLNPGYADGQRSNAVSHIYQTYFSPGRSHMIVDMTHAYSDHATKVKRGFALIDNRTRFLLQDEIKMKAPGEFYWFMHTQANIEIKDNGKSALLSATAQGQTRYMWVRILTDEPNLTFQVMNPVPLPTSPNPSGQAANPGKKLAIHGTNISELRLAVLFVPLPGGPTPPSSWPQVKSLNEWEIGTSAPILYPAADAYVRGGSYANSNFGSVNGIELKNDGDPNYKREGYMKFDVSDVNVPIVSAKLYVSARAVNVASATLGVYRATGNWEEHTLTWNTKPSVGALLDSAVLSDAFEWHELDITDYVQEQQAGSGIVNLALLQNLDPDNRNILIRSREHNDMPYLKLETAPLPAGPTTVLHPAADAYVRDGSYASSNYGNANPLVVKQDPNPGYTREAFLRFDASSVAGPVASAKLYVHAYVSDNQQAALGVYEAAGGWAENTVTWNTKPAVGNFLGSAGLTNVYQWHAVDVTPYVQGQLAGSGMVNLALRQHLDPQGYAMNVHSREDPDFKPYLEITLQPANAANNALTASPGTVMAGSPVTLTAVGDRQSAPGGVIGERRYVPTSWQSTEPGKSGGFTLSGGSYTAVYTPSAAGSYTVTANFVLQEWNGAAWTTLPEGGDQKQTQVTVRETAVLLPAADAFVRDGPYANDNYGNSSVLAVKQDPYPEYTREALMRFDLSAITGPIVSAKLYLYANADGSGAVLGVYRSSGSWAENTVTWNTRPSTGALIQSVPIATEFQWLEIDITAYVSEQQEASGIVQLKMVEIPVVSAHVIQIYSREHASLKPYLYIVHK